MKLPILPLALSALLLSACSTTPVVAPARIPPPPVGLTAKCLTPQPLADNATAQDLGEWTIEWIRAYGCERAKRAALIQAWPQ
jgi:hypothetical protein